MTPNVPNAPVWAELSEDGVLTIDGRDRDVIDHYGTIAQIPFPGHPSPERTLPTLDVHITRCDVIDDADPTKSIPGPYVVTVGTSEQDTTSTLGSISDLERFARELLNVAAATRRVLANDATAATNGVAHEGAPQ